MKAEQAAPRNKSTISRKPPGLAFDCELAARIKEGDRDALRQLVERHVGRVRTYLLHRLGDGNDDTIDNIVSATFSEALRRIGPYASGDAITPMDLWLIRLAERNIVRLHLKTEGSRAGVPDNASDLVRFRAAMSGLSERDRAVLALAVFEQMPAGEMAQALGASPARAMRRLRSALKHVGEALKDGENN